jgi:SAM-dependent methyltransferase
VFLATPQVVVDKMLEVATVTRDDVVYDLGCGDGRVVVTAAKRYGARGVGVEIHPQRVMEARQNARNAGVEHLVRIEQGDIFEVDLSGATVIAVYLFPELNTRLIPQLRRLKAGARIISHDFGIEGVAPERVWKLDGPTYDGAAVTRTHELLLWRAPIGRDGKGHP